MKKTLPDIRYEPLYMVGEAARYLNMHENTLRYWTRGHGRAKPLILRPDGNRIGALMSFVNLVEAQILFSLTKGQLVHLREIRKGLDYILEELSLDVNEHPLANMRLYTDGRGLIVEQLGIYINASKRGQLEIEKVIDIFLQRVDFDADALPVSIYPFSHKIQKKKNVPLHEQLIRQPKPICINPRISFGRPVMAGTGIPTEIVYNRFQSGDELEDLAEDYGRKISEIGAAICYESVRRAA